MAESSQVSVNPCVCLANSQHVLEHVHAVPMLYRPGCTSELLSFVTALLRLAPQMLRAHPEHALTAQQFVNRQHLLPILCAPEIPGLSAVQLGQSS